MSPKQPFISGTALILPMLFVNGEPFNPVKDEMSPDPLKASPIVLLLFAQVIFVPGIFVDQTTGVLSELLHIVSLLTKEMIGVGLIVTEMVSIGPGQAEAIDVGVTS